MSRAARGVRLNSRLKGFKNITYAKIGEAGKHEEGKKLSDGKKIESSLEYEEEEEWAEDKQIEYTYEFSGGKGKLTVLGLTADEYHDLFGNEKGKGGILINTEDKSNPVALMWERKKKGGHRRLYVLYNVICSPIGLGGAESLEKGKGENEQTEIEYVIGSYNDGTKDRIGAFIDTDDPEVDPKMITDWYTTPQFPVKGLESVQEVVAEL